MARHVLLVGLLMGTCVTAQGQWVLQNSNTTADLRGIHNVGGGVAWASGTSGTVLRTEDGGYVWQSCTVPPGAEHLDFRGVQAFDANTAIVMSSGKADLSRLYKTTDGCHSWKLLFTNPDRDGFWDAIQFYDREQMSVYSDQISNGVLVGDPVNGTFVVFETRDGGNSWNRWNIADPKHSGKSTNGESLFAASNECVIAPGSNGPFAFVTGGSTTRVYLARAHSPLDAAQWLALYSIDLGFAAGPTQGAFAIAARRKARSPLAAFLIVGGDYSKPDLQGASAFIPARGKIRKSRQPPHGYRSAVAYDSTSNTWITVGPNGTDISTDDGRTWRPLHPDPTRHETPDADRSWNALSLPFVVGPHGRIGKLNEDVLKH